MQAASNHMEQGLRHYNLCKDYQYHKVMSFSGVYILLKIFGHLWPSQ